MANVKEQNPYELYKQFNEDLSTLAKKYGLTVITVGGMRMSEKELKDLRKRKVLIIDHINLIGKKKKEK